MQKLLLLLSALAVIFFACTNGNLANNNTTPKSAEIPQTTGPDASDLLKTLQGKWQNEQDPTYTLEILDTKMRHIHSGQPAMETDIEVDGNCSSQLCAIDSSAIVDGWCFVEKGPSSMECMFVLTCDKTRLKYAPAAALNLALMFKKL